MMNDRFGKDCLIKSSALRECLFYATWLAVNKGIDISNIPRNDASSCRLVLNEIINQYIPNKVEQKSLLSQMDINKDANILPIDCFDWIEKSERVAFWLWAYLCYANDSDFDFGYNNDQFNWYHRVGLFPSSSSHQERVNKIIYFFDTIYTPTYPIYRLKANEMEKIKGKWALVLNQQEPLKWLPSDNESAIAWAWDSLCKFQSKNNPSLLDSNSFQTGLRLTNWFVPLNHSERNLALRAALDLWGDALDSKKLFLLNLNKSWNQQKLRQSRIDKKALNTYLKNETKKRLDFIADNSSCRISDVLEKIINEYYENKYRR
ncbi:hypothetical protein [Morganella morganii]|uniref:hypothetical protein n=1 Tax=Morganella morganii TaxID=582 RepID=UPI003EB99A63